MRDDDPKPADPHRWHGADGPNPIAEMLKFNRATMARWSGAPDAPIPWVEVDDGGDGPVWTPATEIRTGPRR